MHQYSQQSANFQGQQGFQNQGPTGYVQSHYQGQLSQPTFGRQTNSIVGGAQGGYRGMNQQFASTSHSAFNQPVASYNAYQSHQPVQSHASSPAAAFGNVGPVIAHYGYQAGSDAQQSFRQNASQFNQQANYGGFAQSNAQSGYGMTPSHSYTSSAHPVYEATNAYQQAGPVISHQGWQASSNNSPYSGGMR
ncbi:hypothetical protein [Paenibacillus arenilitoris]|uniref:Uncharacterized protein n=1 Tax=Paenibacillus arenilitoris TaxID=2772299 RepID=A0A927CNZ0_9BACL|nr:hypothetical protein [Paenibacillus arenilitoris]MBD2871499.1 hypothetical protein [Paenibacillus arenilitoris]